MKHFRYVKEAFIVVQNCSKITAMFEHKSIIGGFMSITFSSLLMKDTAGFISLTGRGTIIKLYSSTYIHIHLFL